MILTFADTAGARGSYDEADDKQSSKIHRTQRLRLSYCRQGATVDANNQSKPEIFGDQTCENGACL